MKYKWWRYALAVVVFVVAYFLAPVVVNILYKLLNLFTPRAYQSSVEWIDFITYLLTPIAVLYVVGKVVDGSHKFSMVLMIIGAFYTVFVTTWNYAYGTLSTWTAISMALEAVVFIILAVTEGKKNTEESSSEV